MTTMVMVSSRSILFFGQQTGVAAHESLGYYDSDEYEDSDDYYDDDDDDYDDSDEDDYPFHGHSHGGVPCHGHSHGGGSARKPKSEHYLSMSEVLKNLKQAIEQKDQFKSQANPATATTTVTKAGKGKKKKKVSY